MNGSIMRYRVKDPNDVSSKEKAHLSPAPRNVISPIRYYTTVKVIIHPV